MRHSKPDPSTVAMHQAHDEPLCDQCEAFVARMTGNPAARHPEGVYLEGVMVPSPLFWRLCGLAESAGISMPEYVVRMIAREADPVPTRTKAAVLAEAEWRAEQEKLIIALIKDELSDSAIASRTKLSRETVRRIRKAYKLPSAREYRNRRFDPQIRRLAELGKTDGQIAAALNVPGDYVSQRRQARRIPPGYRVKGTVNG